MPEFPLLLFFSLIKFLKTDSINVLCCQFIICRRHSTIPSRFVLSQYLICTRHTTPHQHQGWKNPLLQKATVPPSNGNSYRTFKATQKSRTYPNFTKALFPTNTINQASISNLAQISISLCS
ncbi:hypothetical protein NE237_027483 [Protea cynaroides]|uniref:Secreted protein n=1 Tax=Protea cynaroides TaxID=273540 RepID=A0A9Q0GPF4_9MAGN|nr:hypothetical protein NE237_027483 [Protea cynaroides]